MEEVEKEKGLMEEDGMGKTSMEMDEKERSTLAAEAVLESGTPGAEVEDSLEFVT